MSRQFRSNSLLLSDDRHFRSGLIRSTAFNGLCKCSMSNNSCWRAGFSLCPKNARSSFRGRQTEGMARAAQLTLIDARGFTKALLSHAGGGRSCSAVQPGTVGKSVAAPRMIEEDSSALLNLRPFYASTIVIDPGPQFLSFSLAMRLLVEILIIAAVIYVGWNKPYKEYVARANSTITSKLDGLGGNLQKHEDSSVKRYQAKP